MTLGKWLKVHEYLPAWFSIFGVLLLLITLTSYIRGIDETARNNKKYIEDNAKDIEQLSVKVEGMNDILLRIDERTKYLVDEHKQSQGK